MRDVLVLTLSASLLAAGCAEHTTSPAVAPSRDVSGAAAPEGAAPRAHLVLAEAAEVTPQSTQKDPPPTLDRPGAGNATARGMGWFSVAVGTLGAGVALTTSLLYLHKKSERDDDCNAAKVCSQDGLNANSQLPALGGWNVGAFAVAAVGLGVGAFLVITNPAGGTGGEKQTAIGVAPTGSGAGLNLRSTF